MSRDQPEPSERPQDPERLIAQLTRVQAYPGPVGEVGFLQTHISLIFFAGERVYKVKKAVELGFLDFSTLERRRHFCEEEVRLNRRLAPGVYLGVVPITPAPDGTLRVGAAGPAVEWAVEMVRLPEERMFASLLERGEIDNAQMNSIADLLVDFHGSCATGPGVDEHGSPEAIAANVEENFEQLREFAGPPSEAAPQADGPARVLSATQLAFLAERGRQGMRSRRSLFERRVRERRIREGHGDLHAGNLCFTPAGLVAFDCIEFNRRFRCGDVASDLAFLCMDLDYRGYRGFSGYLVKRYATGAADAELQDLMGFYKGYRAVVRAKVAALTSRSAGAQDGRREPLRLEAMRYAQLAVGYELPTVLLLMCGLPASGKSWIAGSVAGALRATRLHSDVRRKVLAGLRPTTHVAEEYGAGLYSPAMKERTYAALLEDAREHLRAGRSVVVDATFAAGARRAAFSAAARELGVPCLVLHVSAPESLVAERMRRRAQDPARVSDADFGVYLRARETFEPPRDSPQAPVVELVSRDGPVEEQGSLVLDALIERLGSGPPRGTP